MKLKIEIDCVGSALHDDILEELTSILGTVPGKIERILERDGRCICCALEADDVLKDSNGNTVGVISIEA